MIFYLSMKTQEGKKIYIYVFRFSLIPRDTFLTLFNLKLNTTSVTIIIQYTLPECR